MNFKKKWQHITQIVNFVMHIHLPQVCKLFVHIDLWNVRLIYSSLSESTFTKPTFDPDILGFNSGNIVLIYQHALNLVVTEKCHTFPLMVI